MEAPSVLAPFYDGALLSARSPAVVALYYVEIFGPAIARPSFLMRPYFHLNFLGILTRMFPWVKSNKDLIVEHLLCFGSKCPSRRRSPRSRPAPMPKVSSLWRALSNTNFMYLYLSMLWCKKFTADHLYYDFMYDLILYTVYGQESCGPYLCPLRWNCSDIWWTL